MARRGRGGMRKRNGIPRSKPRGRSAIIASAVTGERKRKV